MKLIIKTAKPRNPLVAIAIKMKAGSHAKPGKAVRRKEKMDTAKNVNVFGELRGRNSMAEYSAFNRSIRVRFSVSLPPYQSEFKANSLRYG